MPTVIINIAGRGTPLADGTRGICGIRSTMTATELKGQARISVERLFAAI